MLNGFASGIFTIALVDAGLARFTNQSDVGLDDLPVVTALTINELLKFFTKLMPLVAAGTLKSSDIWKYSIAGFVKIVAKVGMIAYIFRQHSTVGRGNAIEFGNILGTAAAAFVGTLVETNMILYGLNP